LLQLCKTNASPAPSSNVTLPCPVSNRSTSFRCWAQH
jgi:hypothetical protein